jgi:CubicO group peptidase (beta-lactamase class C family)
MSAADAVPPADLTAWREIPLNRWAFHNIADVLPVAQIEASGDPWALGAASRSLDGFRLHQPDGSSLDLAGFLAATSTDGLVVLLDGQVVHETYGNGTAAHTPHILMSATKSVTGLIVGILHDRGILDADGVVSDLVPEITQTAYRGATLRQLLDMRTGVLLDKDEEQAYAAATGWELAASGPADLHAYFAKMAAPHREHGGPFSYISANTDLLGWALERASGRSFASLVSELLWQPMGAADGAYVTTDHRGAARCAGGLCATVRDLARLGRLVAQDGRRGDRQVVPAAWIDDMAHGGDHQAWAHGEWGKLFGFAGASLRYRGGWYAVDDAPEMLFAMGTHGQNLFVDRAAGLVVAKVSSQNRIDYQALPLTHRGVEEIRRCLRA